MATPSRYMNRKPALEEVQPGERVGIYGSPGYFERLGNNLTWNGGTGEDAATNYGLPNLDNLPSATSSVGGISASDPAAAADAKKKAEEDIRKKAEEEFAPGNQLIEQKYSRRIEDIQGTSKEQQRALEGQMGTGRRFSTSAQAFIKFMDEKAKKEILALEEQRDAALLARDTEMAKIISQRITDARKAQSEDIDNALKMLEYDKKVKEKIATDPKVVAGREAAIVDIYNQGVTDPTAIFGMINYDDQGKLIGDVSLKEIDEAMKKFQVDKAEIDKLVVDMGKAGASETLIEKVSRARSISEAVKLAGDAAMTTTSGVVGEYMFYRREAERMGETPVNFNTYQDIDANRKKSIAAAQAGLANGMTAKQQQVFNSMATELRKSNLYQAGLRSRVLESTIADIKEDPTNGANQLALVYGFIKALDQYESAVREGEIGLVQSLLNWRGKLTVFASNLEDDKLILDEKTIKNIATAAGNLVETIKVGADLMESDFKQQANTNGFMEQWDDYRGAIDRKLTRDVTVDVEQIRGRIAEWAASNPEHLSQYEGLVKENPDLSDFDIAQILGIKLK